MGVVSLPKGSVKYIIIVLLAGGWWVWKARQDYSGAVRNFPPSNARILMLGDSMTAGVGADPGNDLPTLLAKRLGRPVINAGVSGETTRSVLGRVDKILSSRPGTLIVLLGGNDVLRKIPAEEVERNLASIIERAQGAGCMVVLVGMNGRPLDGMSGVYVRLAKQYQCLFVPDILDGIFFNNRYKADAIHPNSEGYVIMADRIAERLKPYLE